MRAKKAKICPGLAGAKPGASLPLPLGKWVAQLAQECPSHMLQYPGYLGQEIWYNPVPEPREDSSPTNEALGLWLSANHPDDSMPWPGCIVSVHPVSQLCARLHSPPGTVDLCQRNASVHCPQWCSNQAGTKAGIANRGEARAGSDGLVPRVGAWGHLGAVNSACAHHHPCSLADSLGRADGTTPAEPTDPNDNEPGDISLHPVESISDLHWASGGHKSAEGNGPARSSTPHRPRARPATCTTPHQPLLPMLRPVPATTACPCLGPCHPLFLALLGILALASLVLATLAIYLSVLQSQSVRVLVKWLESQEEAVQQLQATSGQLWARLNASVEAGGHR
nr:PREDICTED: leucine-rich single-pass membrane protein 2 [Apteryx mantelli mantelli]